MKKILLILTVLFFVLAAMVGAGYWFYTNQSTILKPNSDVYVVESTFTPVNKTPVNTKSTVEGVREALAKKHEWNLDEIVVTTTEDTGVYATGTVVGKNSEIGGGIWFAQNTDNGWELVWDGNGLVFCSDLEKYPDFPTSLIPQCYDAYSGDLADR